MLPNSKIDVFAVNESKIDSSVTDNEISMIPGYNMIRKDRNRFWGWSGCVYSRGSFFLWTKRFKFKKS